MDQVRQRRLIAMLVYTGLALAFLVARLVPLAPGSVGWPGPDLTLCLTFFWVLRRPDQLPALLIAAVFLLGDILLLRPLGLWSAIAVMATEAARSREPRWREHRFLVEWLRVTILMALMVLAYRFAAAIFFVPLPSLGQVILQLIATSAAYPFVALAGRWILGVTRPDVVEAEMIRHR